MRTRPSRPTASAAATVSPSASPSKKPTASGMNPSASTEKPNSLELTHQDREGEPVHVADLGRLGQQVGDEPQLGDPGEHGHHPDQQRQHRGERDRTLRVPVGPHGG